MNNHDDDNHPPMTGLAKKNLGFLRAKKQAQQKITMLTGYDYPTACLEDQAGIDIILVGDSVGTNVLGYASEREVTMEDMVHHLKAVRRGVVQAYLLVDLPYQSYDTPQLALVNATTLLAHGADAVKLEGGVEQVEAVRRLTAQGITVCGHIGFTPQTLHQPGRKARVQGRSSSQAIALLESALALEHAGAQLLVLELIPEPLGKAITECLRIPTIGIGAGRFCDGQVLIIHDLLGLTPFHLRFVKRYQHFRELTLQAIAHYKHDVEEGFFPGGETAFQMDEGERLKVEQWMQQSNRGPSEP
ncbi:MAG TPA: 3-methyl-2-oxobutanoate hydroxymethyltransferase [Candidatus Tectomicrobia bacterium]|nr:3-methyl-2-oxobutanoate hydroxymethyltransferase [Candidatus Tectomicrobia bacterium]